MTSTAMERQYERVVAARERICERDAPIVLASLNELRKQVEAEPSRALVLIDDAIANCQAWIAKAKR